MFYQRFQITLSLLGLLILRLEELQRSVAAVGVLVIIITVKVWWISRWFKYEGCNCRVMILKQLKKVDWVIYQELMTLAGWSRLTRPNVIFSWFCPLHIILNGITLQLFSSSSTSFGSYLTLTWCKCARWSLKAFSLPGTCDRHLNKTIPDCRSTTTGYFHLIILPKKIPHTPRWGLEMSNERNKTDDTEHKSSNSTHWGS